MASSDGWISAGPVSSISDITTSGPDQKTKILSASASSSDSQPQCSDTPCKILLLPPTSSSTPGGPPKAESITPDQAQETIGLQPQVLIFRYRNKIHAIDHACPHRTYPLSRGSLYDIEDFGIILSAGIVCPRHGWAFDVNTGQSDRGSYVLGVWDVQVRDGEGGEGEVWIRKKE